MASLRLLGGTRVLMPLYTLTANLRLGTYLAQLHAPSHEAALHAYAKDSDLAFLTEHSAPERDELRRKLLEVKLKRAGDLKSVWTAGVLSKNDLYLVHVVQTECASSSAT